ncbi:peptide methionine sulfoxide reductase MsrA [Bradyrhizobium sp. LM6.10]|jgi:hypothetical protein
MARKTDGLGQKLMGSRPGVMPTGAGYSSGDLSNAAYRNRGPTPR